MPDKNYMFFLSEQKKTELLPIRFTWISPDNSQTLQWIWISEKATRDPRININEIMIGVSDKIKYWSSNFMITKLKVRADKIYADTFANIYNTITKHSKQRQPSDLHRLSYFCKEFEWPDADIYETRICFCSNLITSGDVYRSQAMFCSEFRTSPYTEMPVYIQERGKTLPSMKLCEIFFRKLRKASILKCAQTRMDHYSTNHLLFWHNYIGCSLVLKSSM